nr:MAG TPA: hypothetical protein [Caudoviricetes sp.]
MLTVMSNNTTYASRHTDCGFAMEVISDSLSIYKVSKRGNESLLCIKNSHDEITVTLRHAKLLLESLSRLIEDRTITGPQPVYNFKECVNAGRIVKRG